MIGVEYTPKFNGQAIDWTDAEKYGKNNLTFEAFIDGDSVGEFDRYLDARIHVEKTLRGAVVMHRANMDRQLAR